MIAHHDHMAIEALKASGRPGAGSLRIVDDRTAALPLEKHVCAAPDRLLQTVGTLLRPRRENSTVPARLL